MDDTKDFIRFKHDINALNQCVPLRYTNASALAIWKKKAAALMAKRGVPPGDIEAALDVYLFDGLLPEVRALIERESLTPNPDPA